MEEIYTTEISTSAGRIDSPLTTIRGKGSLKQRKKSCRRRDRLHLSNYFEANAHLEDKEQFDSCTYQFSSEEQDAKELQEEVLGEQ